MENEQTELIYKFQIFEQQINAINQQLQAIEKAINDMTKISLGLGEIKEGREILASVGTGIYAKAKLISEELIIDIGSKNMVSKTIPETEKLIGEQIEKLEDAQDKLNKELSEINTELTKTMMQYEKGHVHSHECSCNHEGECSGECGDDCECEK
jgi:prefoldin alpha subunit